MYIGMLILDIAQYCRDIAPLMSVWSLDEVEHDVQELVSGLGVWMIGYHTQQHWNQLLPP